MKIEGICNALSPVKLNTSVVMEVFILDRFWDEMLDACNEVTLVKYSFTSSRWNPTLQGTITPVKLKLFCGDLSF